MSWTVAVKWAIFWAAATGRRHRVTGYRNGVGRWCYSVSTGTR